APRVRRPGARSRRREGPASRIHDPGASAGLSRRGLPTGRSPGSPEDAVFDTSRAPLVPSASAEEASPSMHPARPRSRPAPRPRWLAAALRAPMSPAEIGTVIRTLRRRAPAWRPTAVAEVAAEQPDPFRVLIACLLSLRTQDATTRVASERLFGVADTPH